MSYWRGLLVAAVLDVALIAGSASVAPVAPQLADMDHLVDSLMVVVQGDSLNVGAMEELAHLYANHGWHEAAIGPLARALQRAPERRRLWVALDRAVAASGRETITDAELIEAARRFAEAVDMWGHGC